MMSKNYNAHCFGVVEELLECLLQLVLADFWSKLRKNSVNIFSTYTTGIGYMFSSLSIRLTVLVCRPGRPSSLAPRRGL